MQFLWIILKLQYLRNKRTTWDPLVVNRGDVSFRKLELPFPFAHTIHNNFRNVNHESWWYTSLYFMKDHKTGIFTGTQYWVLPWESSKLWYDDHEWKSQMFSVMAQHIFHDDEEDRTAWGVFYVLTKVFLYDVEISRVCWMC